MKNWILILVGIIMISLAACNTEAPKQAALDGYVISGTITNANAGTKVYLDDLQRNLNRVIDTATVNSDGTFEMSGNLKEGSIAQLRIGFQKVLFLLDKEETVINLDMRVPNTYEITGSSDNNTWKTTYDKLKNRTATPQYLKGVADTASNVLVGYLAISQMKPEDEYKTFQSFVKKMKQKMPGSKLTKELEQRVAKAASLANLGVGKPAPEITLNDPKGNPIALSSLKGNVVLLDFWASWCRPCRKENPTVVAAYDKYKDKGFTVYSVSLDKTAPKWETAIKQDNLKWDNHVSDLKGWGSSAAALYGVRSIPQTFLIGKDGKIIAKNLRGHQLESKLAEIL